jgi:hypothetical protein
MKKLYILALLTIINITFAAQTRDKLTFIFEVVLANSGRAEDSAQDKLNKASCGHLGIEWPSVKRFSLWKLEQGLCYTRSDDPAHKKYTSWCIPLKHFSHDLAKEVDFQFPQALPDPFVRSLVHHGEVKLELSKVNVVFQLKNTEKSLMQLGLIDDPDQKLSQLCDMFQKLKAEETSSFSLANILWVGGQISLVALLVWLCVRKSA